MEGDGTVDNNLSLNKTSEVYLIYDMQVLAWYFTKELTYSNRFAEMQWNPDTIGLIGRIFQSIYAFYVVHRRLVFVKN